MSSHSVNEQRTYCDKVLYIIRHPKFGKICMQSMGTFAHRMVLFQNGLIVLKQLINFEIAPFDEQEYP